MIKVGDIFTCKKTLWSGHDYDIRFNIHHKYKLIRINELGTHPFYFINEGGNEHWFNRQGLEKWFTRNKFKYGK